MGGYGFGNRSRDINIHRRCITAARKKRNRIMGAIAMFILVSLISIVSVIYFTIQDRKEERQKREHQ